MRRGGSFGIAIGAAMIALALAASTASAASISGIVADASTGNPIQGVQVTAWPQAGSIESVGRTAFSDASGHYSFDGLAAGDYAIQLLPSGLNYVGEYFDGKRSEEEADLVHLGAGETRSGIDVTLDPGGRIVGQVQATLSGAPLSEVSVCAYSASDFTGGCGKTGVSGAYIVQGLPTDSYIVDFAPYWSLNYFEGWYAGAADREDATWVPVVEGQTTSGIDGALRESAGISGTLTDAESGEPLAEIEVCAIAVGGEEFPRCSSSGADGHYLVGGMPSDEYKLVFSPERERDREGAQADEDGYFAQYYREAPTRAAADAFRLTAPSLTTGINARLTPKEPHPHRPTAMPPAPWPPAPNAKPATYIVSEGTRIRGRSARFHFISSPFENRFECRIDRWRWSRCISPKVYRHLDAGKHIFEVRALDAEGNRDPSPARFGEFTIRPRG